MKKLILIMTVLAAIGLMAMPALAAVGQTAHDAGTMGYGSASVTGGVCSMCHLPHAAAGGDRLWPSQPQNPGSKPLTGVVAGLCGYCHLSGGGAAGAGEAPMDAEDSDPFVYHDNSHGVVMSVGVNGATALPPQQLASGLPYIDDAADEAMECTSCHDVHNNPSDKRPFLRANINLLCALCHGERMVNNSSTWLDVSAVNGMANAGSWGTAQMGVDNPGSHPVGADVTEATGDASGDSPIIIPAAMGVGLEGTAGQWDLGGHLTGGNTGGVTCTTCHAVHGVIEDRTAGTHSIAYTNFLPNENFLTVTGGGTATLGGRTVANGDAGARNYLCEACHQGSPVANAAYGAASGYPWITTQGGGTKLASNPNPGATSYTHPVDQMPARTGTAWVVTIPNGDWPVGVGGSPVIDPAIICESCHAPHLYADRARSDINIPSLSSGDYIVRNGDSNSVCSICHSSSATAGANHHPVGDTFYGAGTANGVAFSVQYLTNVTGAGAAIVQCSTCHVSAGGGGAHNWTSDPGSGYNLDPNWIPYDNARSDANRVADSLGTTCMDCHYTLENADSNGLSPTDNVGTGTHDLGYDVIGSGTHFMGLTSKNGVAWTDSAIGDLWAEINPETTAWNGRQTQTATDAYSWFGSTGVSGSVVIVCESCHELEPDKNDGPHLLLADYRDGTTDEAENELCTGCHFPKGTHPTTGVTVGTQGDHTLRTDWSTASVTWFSQPSDSNMTDIAEANPGNFTCDNCHQPHDANTASRTFILDASNTTISAASHATNLTTLTPGTGGTYAAKYFPMRSAPRTGGANLDVGKYCNECHNYQ